MRTSSSWAHRQLSEASVSNEYQETIVNPLFFSKRRFFPGSIRSNTETLRQARVSGRERGRPTPGVPGIFIADPFAPLFQILRIMFLRDSRSYRSTGFVVLPQAGNDGVVRGSYRSRERTAADMVDPLVLRAHTGPEHGTFLCIPSPIITCVRVPGPGTDPAGTDKRGMQCPSALCSEEHHWIHDG